ncbi:penicillin-insensitive murein endopeptidase [Rhodopseudomonas sp. BR0M22]|uniref:penicillin-insensitive murein endopeptidase n=1 Tax=Rhodopseudomonas sp. BR0M22 TaxID=2269369 RepID=UPI0013DF7650|nr:penicillin-insensitive murein endopeptidase [Rhodopseudomonas sp. BR0M22]NEW91589.1 penicillin-insensitive murein endopeptidase [Rhodopseudomonas sp. BR0M22]
MRRAILDAPKLLATLLVTIPLWVAIAEAQDKGTLHPKPLPPLANPSDPNLAARELFARKLRPAAMPPQPVGFYAKGCLAGGEALPINGPTWQVMRLSRNRNWALPETVRLLERVAERAHEQAGWPGILVGDMSQPRGGPMLTGHASHQVGLDADIWLTPMPNRQLSRNEREEMSAVMMVRRDRLDIEPSAWTPTHWKVIRAAALEPRVERIFVNAAIKKALCREARGDRSWLHKVRPMYGHDYHFHIRLSCPPGVEGCVTQPEPPAGEGCSASDFAYWFSDAVLHPKPPTKPPKPRHQLTLSELPAECGAVLAAPDKKQD